MNKYECVVVIKGQLEADAVKAWIEKTSNVITSNNGTIDSVDEWGKKRLAYAIDDITEGYYVMFNFEGDSLLPAEFERNLKISDDVLRFITVKKES